MPQYFRPKRRAPGDPEPPKRPRGRPRKPEPDPGIQPKLSKLEEEEARRQRREERATIKRLEAESRIRQAKEAILAGKVPPPSYFGPKDYDWKAVFLEIYRESKSKLKAREAAGVVRGTVASALHDDPVFALQVAAIAEEILEDRIDSAEEVKDSLFQAAVSVGEPNAFGSIDSARVASAKLWLQAYDPARFAERPKVGVAIGLTLPGVVLQAISEAAGRMTFEALPEAQAEVVGSDTW